MSTLEEMQMAWDQVCEYTNLPKEVVEETLPRPETNKDVENFLSDVCGNSVLAPLLGLVISGFGWGGPAIDTKRLAGKDLLKTVFLNEVDDEEDELKS